MPIFRTRHQGRPVRNNSREPPNPTEIMNGEAKCCPIVKEEDFDDSTDEEHLVVANDNNQYGTIQTLTKVYCEAGTTIEKKHIRTCSTTVTDL